MLTGGVGNPTTPFTRDAINSMKGPLKSGSRKYSLSPDARTQSVVVMLAGRRLHHPRQIFLVLSALIVIVVRCLQLLRLKCTNCNARKAHCWPEPYGIELKGS